jgi:hypothetical protein
LLSKKARKPVSLISVVLWETGIPYSDDRVSVCEWPRVMNARKASARIVDLNMLVNIRKI